MSGLYFSYLTVTYIWFWIVEDNIELPQKYHTYELFVIQIPFREKAVLVNICSLKTGIISPLNTVITV